MLPCQDCLLALPIFQGGRRRVLVKSITKRRSAESQVSASSLKTRVTCARAPSYYAACFTMWRGTKPTWQQSTPSVTQIAVVVVSSFSATINCNLRRRTTTSSFNTSPQISFSSHEWPWQLIVVPTILTRISHGWMGLLNNKGTDAAAGTEERAWWASSPQVRAPQPRQCRPQQEKWAWAQQWAQAPHRAEESSSGACRGAWQAMCARQQQLGGTSLSLMYPKRQVLPWQVRARRWPPPQHVVLPRS